MELHSKHASGCERIFEGRISGAKAERQGLSDALEFIREGDTLVVWRLDRLGRSLPDLIEIVGHLGSRKIGLQRIHESIDTASSTGKLMFHILSASAECERSLVRERTQPGLKAARARGLMGGRPKALDSDQRKLVVRLYEEKQYTIQQ